MTRKTRVALASGALVLAAGTVAAQETPNETPPVQVDVTEAASLVWNGDNRNTREADVSSVTDDDFGYVYNRLTLQANWMKWNAGLRLDSFTFFAAPSPASAALRLLEEGRDGSSAGTFSQADARFFTNKFLQAGTQLNNRYVSWVYPAKFSLSYRTPALELTLGDYYAQFGRGFVLSVRKQDELSSDTTIKGARLSARVKAKSVKLKGTLIGGLMNPLRFDDASGRTLAVSDRVLSGPAHVTEALMPRAVTNDFIPSAAPNYAPDAILGLSLESQFAGANLSLQGTRLARNCLQVPTADGERCASLAADLVRSAQTIDTGGAALDLPNLSDSVAAYFEYAAQRLSDFSELSRADVSGFAAYSSINVFLAPVSLTLEAKHVRSFYPLLGNVDTLSAPEFSPVQYSAPPTTEALWVDTAFEGFHTCVSGGRAKVDLEATDQAGLFVWLGRYHTWAESASAGSCDVADENENQVWDFAQGLELSGPERRSRATAVFGTRMDTASRALQGPVGAPTRVFYREQYLRHDIIYWLGGETSLQFQGWHRRRHQTLGGPAEPWVQGTTVTSLQLGREINFAFGFEYDQNPAFPDLYFNGQAKYNLNDASYLSLFVGQQQGGLKCISGVCRVFPPFEGARLDATFRL